MEWYRKGYELYNPSYDTIAKIKKRISVYLIEVVIDLECKDVHYLIPKLFKTLYMCEVNHCATYSVNFKNLPAIINSKTIIKTPTIIFTKSDKEHFRITEKLVHTSTIENEIEILLSRNQL